MPNDVVAHIHPGLILPHQGARPKIAVSAFVAPNAVLVGDVEIGEGSSIWFNCVLRADVQSIRVGKRVNIQDGTIVHVSEKGAGTVIGDEVSVGHAAVLHACTLQSNSFVGMGAMVLDEAVVESGAMVAAGALLTPGKRVPTGQLWAGRPAKYFRDLTEKDLENFRRTVENYAAVAVRYRREMWMLADPSI